MVARQGFGRYRRKHSHRLTNQHHDQLKMSGDNYNRCKSLFLYIIIVIFSQTGPSLTQSVQDDLSTSSEYTIHVNNKDTSPSSGGDPLNCIDCYKISSQNNPSQPTLKEQNQQQRSSQDNSMDYTPQDVDSDHNLNIAQTNETNQNDFENIPSRFESQTQQQLARGFDQSNQSNSSYSYTNQQVNSRNDSYNTTIYNSLLKILFHMKQQLDRTKLRERDDHERDSKKSSNQLEPFSASVMGMNSINGNGIESNPSADDFFNKRLERVLANHPLDQDSSNLEPSEQNSYKDSKNVANSPPSLFPPQTGGTQTSFKPILGSEVSSDPLTNGNLISGPLLSTNTIMAEMVPPQPSSSPQSSQFTLPDHSTNNVRNIKKSINYSNTIPQQNQNQLPAASIPFMPSRFEYRTSIPPPLRITEKYGHLMSPSFDDQRQIPSSLDNKNSQQYGFTTESSMLEPNYDLPMETTSNTYQPSGTNQQKRFSIQQLNKSQQQYIDYPEENYDTQTTVDPTPKPRFRSRRSKVSNKQTPNQIVAVRPVAVRRLRTATDLMSRDQVLAEPQQDSSSSLGVAEYIDNQQQSQIHLPSTRSHADHSGVHLQQVLPIPINQHHQSQPMQRSQQQQQAVYTLAAAPPGLNFKGFLHHGGGGHSSQTAQTSLNSASHESPISAASTIGQPQRDLVNQPQTIQITAVPNVGLQNQPLVRVNGASLPFSNLLNNGLYGMNGFLDPFGRQVVMVNAERRQVDWSFWFWPILLAVTLPVVLGALFVPVFLKTIVMLIQVLQSLGLLLPLTNALTNQIAKASGVSTGNQIEHVKS